MKYIIYSIIFITSIFCFSQAEGQGVSVFGANRPQDTSKTKGQIVAPVYSNTDTNKVLTGDATGHFYYVTKGNGSSIDTTLFVRYTDTSRAGIVTTYYYVDSLYGSIGTHDSLVKYSDSNIVYATQYGLDTAIAGIPILDTTSLSNRVNTKVTKGGDSDGVALEVGTNDNFSLRFRTNGVERMRLLTNGRLLINTVTDVGAELYVSGVTRLGNSLITSTGALALASVGHALGTSNIYINNTTTGTSFFGNGTDVNWIGGTTNALMRLARFKGFVINDQAVYSTPSSSCILYTVSSTKGVLFSPMTAAQWAAIASKDDGLEGYDTDNKQKVISNSTTTYWLNKSLPHVTAVLDFPSTGANDISDLTATVTGAAVGDIVAIGVPSYPQGVFTGFVSSSNTVTIRFHNSAGGSYDPASGSFKISVIK